jgi:hypothetical protein
MFVNSKDEIVFNNKSIEKIFNTAEKDKIFKKLISLIAGISVLQFSESQSVKSVNQN